MSVIAIEQTVEIVEVGTVGPAGPIAADLPITAVTYDGSSRVTSFNRAGVQYLVTYPSALQIVITGGGTVRTVTLDESGRIISSV